MTELQDSIFTMIGEECDMLGIRSQFSYICKTKVLVYACPIKHFYQELICLNPVGLRELKSASVEKIKHFYKLLNDKKKCDNAVAEIESHKLADEKENKMKVNVQKLFPKADKPAMKNLMNILRNKEALGEP